MHTLQTIFSKLIQTTRQVEFIKKQREQPENLSSFKGPFSLSSNTILGRLHLALV